MKKTCAVLLVSFFSLSCLLSCGLEAFYYIDYIPTSDMQNTTRAAIRLPLSSDEGYSNYFTHFIIFYRIYISDVYTEARIASPDTRDVWITVNSTLNSDFLGLYSSTDKTSTNVNTANLETTFLNRRYFQLELENESITNILGRGSLGKTLEIVFQPNQGWQPRLSLIDANDPQSNKSYILWRVKGDDILGITPFYPKPNDRYFLNYPELYDAANATSLINYDVAASTSTGADARYTYVSMYIAAKGKSYELPPRDIYSQPTFIGVFRLAPS